MQFKVGDYVIGGEGSSIYTYTEDHCVCEVVDVKDRDICVRVLSFLPGHKWHNQVNSAKSQLWWVEAKHFIPYTGTFDFLQDKFNYHKKRVEERHLHV